MTVSHVENPKRGCRATTACANTRDSALRKAVGAESRSSNQEAKWLSLEREKTWLAGEGTNAPNENEMSCAGRGRAWLWVEGF